jgi:cytochrome c-type biogenesis protein CcmH/NrfG
LIWIVAVAVVIVIGGTWLVAKSLRTRAVVFLAAVAAVGGYALLGHPSKSDQPLSNRVEGLEQEAKATPEKLTADQVMAIAERRSKQQPADPQPHYIMGIVLKSAGKPNEAVLAFESALRRDPNFTPALVSLADLLFESSGEVAPDVQKLYQQALTLAPDDLRLGYMSGLGEWQAGHEAEARARWTALEARTPAGDTTLKTLANDLFKMSGRVDPWTTELFRAAYQQNPEDLQVGYFYGIGEWQAGRHAEADALWASIEAKTASSDPRRQMFAALKEAFRKETPAANSPAAPAPPPGKPPG